MDLNSVNITATQVAKNYFSAYVENGFIYSYSVYGERQQVGVTVEKQQIIDTARTQYMIENTAKQTQEQAMALANALGTKIDFYEYQNLRDQLAQERTKNVVLENRVYSDAKFNALERQNEAMFGVLKSEIADLSCNVPKRPPYYAQGFVTCGSPIPNGCCN